jgi:predicted nucleic acid-binding protein
MLDTNVLVSALLFPCQNMNTLIYKITTEHQLVLSSYVVDELLNVTRRKFKGKAEAVDLLLSRLPYELVYTPKQPKRGLFEIRDEKDYPVLYSAIIELTDWRRPHSRQSVGVSGGLRPPLTAGETETCRL